MRRAAAIGVAVAALAAVYASAKQGAPRSGLPARFGLGRAAAAAEIKAWDIDVMPDGDGLPPGSGTPAGGAKIYARKCAACHGPSGTEGPFDRLVGRDRAPVRTIGNYWPYATTLYDYIHRAMPLAAPGSLTPDEVYSLVVGASGFEPPTSWSRTRRANRTALRPECAQEDSNPQPRDP